MQHRVNDRIINSVTPKQNVLKWMLDSVNLLQLEIKNLVTGISKARSAHYEMYYNAFITIKNQKGKKDKLEFCTYKELVAALTTVNAQMESAKLKIWSSEEKSDDENSNKKRKNPELLALLFLRKCKRADILLKPHHVEEFNKLTPLEFQKEMIRLQVRASRFWKMSMMYDYTEEEDSRDDTVQDDRKFIELRTLVDNLRNMFVKQSVMGRSVRKILTKTCDVQLECKEHIKYVENQMEKIDNYHEIANAFSKK